MRDVDVLPMSCSGRRVVLPICELNIDVVQGKLLTNCCKCNKASIKAKKDEESGTRKEKIQRHFP